MKNYLENQIDKLITWIIENNLGFGWKNHPLRNHQGVYIDGEPFDYTIMTKKGFFCFDTKETKKNTWSILDKDIKQACNLHKCSKFGAASFFLIYFITSKKLLKIDIDKFLAIISERKHIKMSECIEFTKDLIV
jgi:penicillin-binding protein-related factor A (putative recombinase)